MKIVITGGAGFIGSHLAEVFLPRSDVTIIDNLLTGRMDNLPPKARFVLGDITASYDIERAMEDSPDVVIHCAASYDDPRNHSRNVWTNAYGTKVIVDLCDKYKVQKLVYFQTSLCYGRPKERPITLDHPIAPICSYAITKTAGEFFVRSGKTPYLIFRLANIYGPRNLSGPISIFYKNIREGKQSIVSDTRRDYVYVSDLVDLVFWSVLGDMTGIYHASSQRDVLIEELYSMVCKAMQAEADEPKRVNHSPLDIEHLLLDSSYTEEKLFGWRPRVSYDIGLKKAVEWYDAHEYSKCYSHLEKV